MSLEPRILEPRISIVFSSEIIRAQIIRIILMSEWPILGHPALGYLYTNHICNKMHEI